MIDIKSFARCVGIALIEKGFSVSPLKFQKILYYQQAWHLVFFSQNEFELSPLFEECPEAWINGPVYPTVFQEYKNAVDGMCEHLRYSHFHVDENNASEELKRLVDSLLNDSEKDLFNQVEDLYGSISQGKLVLMTHAEDPWLEQRRNLSPLERSSNKISFRSMYNFYKNRYEQNHARQADTTR